MSERPVGETFEGADTRASAVIPVDKTGAVIGGSAAAAQYVQGANFAVASRIMTFGNPAAVPAHSTAFAGNVLAAAAQAQKIAIAAPATGKGWQALQIQLRWTVAPGAPVVATPDLFLVIYWETAAGWHQLYWPAKYLTDASAIDDLRAFSDFTELTFPQGTTAFAVGVAGYVGGQLFADLVCKA